MASVAIASSTRAAATEPGAEEPKVSGSITGSYYALPHQSDFGVGVASINRGSLRFEARYNYEARRAASAFVGWKLAGDDAVTYEIIPIVGGLLGAAHAVIPGVEASIAYRSFDVYVEAEFVSDLQNHANSYFYSWNEIGWRPVQWLRLGLVGQRTRTIHNDRDLQRGVFGQLTFGSLTTGMYAFNPDGGSRYAVVSFAINF